LNIQTTTTTIVLWLIDFVQDNPGEPVPERWNQSGFTEARDSEWQWHLLGHMQICTSPQTDNHTSTPPFSFFTGWMPFLPPNQQHQSTEGPSPKITKKFAHSLTGDINPQSSH